MCVHCHNSILGDAASFSVNSGSRQNLVFNFHCFLLSISRMIFTVFTLTVQTRRSNSITSSFRLENGPRRKSAEFFCHPPSDSARVRDMFYRDGGRGCDRADIAARAKSECHPEPRPPQEMFGDGADAPGRDWISDLNSLLSPIHRFRPLCCARRREKSLVQVFEQLGN